MTPSPNKKSSTTSTRSSIIPATASAIYAASLKRELPRIPLAPDFAAFVSAGKELSRLHVHYESLEPWPLEEIINKDVPYSERAHENETSPPTSVRFASINPSAWTEFRPKPSNTAWARARRWNG